jgi:hypothetical protein
MGNGIIRIKDRYLEWSTVSDAPASPAMLRCDFTGWYLRKYGTSGCKDLDHRLERVDKNGSSYLPYYPLEDVLSCNRAGPDETEITADEIYERYI